MSSELNEMSFEELLKVQEELEKVIKAKSKDAKKEGITRYKALLAEAEAVKKSYGLSDADIKGKGKGNPRGAMKPKYQFPDGSTWTGGGQTPKVLKALIAEGHSKEEYLISHPE